ncbi:DUF4430 domain-containing protein [Lacipirellula parvula]|uniref:Transcobalamin-like C-terminal domain-containing protein n=1 Tax=Lacipirellula parvula TaxID=2650471 RepID=A0A5K7XND7_9BACT|nr:DUF4430 domain-containing protein [Lacipirellula parvula]BBO36556.1 hypothetical protein PLANPX_6168 [Lacipirellula parvula]
METPAPSPVSQLPSTSPTGRPWALPLVLAVAFATTGWLLVSFRNSSHEGPPSATPAAGAENLTAAPEPGVETASLEIRYGNGARREIAALPWHEGMTVGDLMRLAQKFRPGIEFTHTGKEEMSFLTSLDGVANEGADGRFWVYDVGGRKAQVSYEVQPLAAGERVLWVFKRPE